MVYTASLAVWFIQCGYPPHFRTGTTSTHIVLKALQCGLGKMSEAIHMDILPCVAEPDTLHSDGLTASASIT